MPTASEDLGSPRDVIRNWLSRTNGCDKPSVGGKRHGHDMDDNMHGKYQQLADHHSGTRKVQEESVSGLRQRRRTEAKALQTNAGALASTFKNGTHTEDFWMELDNVGLADSWI